jgi:transposase
MTINKETRVAACLMFLSGGVTRTDVAKQFGVDNSTVADWLRRLEDEGEDALDYPHADRTRKNHLLKPDEIYMAMKHCQKRSLRARLSRLLYLANGSTLAQVSVAHGITKQAVMKDRAMWLSGNFPTQKNSKA